jgi:hypothetical protein
VLSEEHQSMMLAYLSGLRRGPRLRSLEDLAALSSRELLQIAARVEESALGLFLQLLKCCGDGKSLFERLMGDHEEDNRPLVDAFFERYRSSVLAPDGPGDFNPLETYLPAHALDDLAFVQSRQAFFLRQTCAVINAYLDTLFPAPDGGKHAFPAGEQEKAWAYFWAKVIAK